MPQKLADRWETFEQAASSSDEFMRTFALAASVKCLEIGLTAIGIPTRRREGIQSRIQGLGTIVSQKSFPSEQSLKTAFRNRNQAVHQDRVPDAEQCRKSIATFFQVWRALRRSFVTRPKAAKIAAKLLETDNIKQVFLFGSLARRRREPKDIDLLVFDDGEISSLSSRYGLARLKNAAESQWPVEWSLENEFFSDVTHRAAVYCGWLDYVFVDGSRFGTDKKYTLRLCETQPDSIFFVNIADGILHFDGNKWADNHHQVFKRLALLRGHLENENIVAPQSRRKLTSS